MKKFFSKKIIFSILGISLIGAGAFIGINHFTNKENSEEAFLNKKAMTLSVEESELSDDPVVNIGFNIFKLTFDGKTDTVISPLSICSALGMLTTGADGETLSQLEDALGVSCDELDACMKDYISRIDTSESCKFKIANSIWLQDRFSDTVFEDYISKTNNCYNAEVFTEEFNSETINSINNWVSKNTDGKINKIVDDKHKSSDMILVNALALDAKWEESYEEDDMADDIFTLDNGTEKTVEYMVSKEDVYLEDDDAKGFIKYYSDRKYAFATLLPNEGITLAEYVDNLSCKELKDIISNPKTKKLNTYMPGFEAEYTCNFIEKIQKLGVIDVFNPSESNLSKISSEPLYVTDCITKSKIKVDETGTEATAATAIAALTVGFEPGGYYVYEDFKLNRPFLYMIIDCNSNSPVFIGAVTDVK